jgi:hypothetical protein
VLAAPEALMLRGLNGMTWNGKLEHVWARKNSSREGWSETQDLSAPFECLFVHDIQLMGGWDELVGVRELRDEGTLEDVYFAVDESWSVVDGVRCRFRWVGSDQIGCQGT